MKLGARKPSFNKSFSTKTKGRVTRTIKKATIPGYGQKGMGYIKDPKRAVKNAVYQKTAYSAFPSSSARNSRSREDVSAPMFWPVTFIVATIIAPVWMILKGISFSSALIAFLCGFLLVVCAVMFSNRKLKTKQERARKEDLAQKEIQFLTKQIENDIRIYQESLTICNDTKDLDTLYSRFDVASTSLNRLRSRRLPEGVSVAVSNFDELPGKLAESKSTLVKNCIERAYNDTVEKAKGLKTERGKRVRIERFFGDLLTKHVHQLTDEEIQYAQSLAKTSGVIITIRAPTSKIVNEAYLLEGPADYLGTCSRCKKQQPKDRKRCFYCGTTFANQKADA